MLFSQMFDSMLDAVPLGCGFFFVGYLGPPSVGSGVNNTTPL